jgi:predicted RNase H-like HicB family nuclease
LRKRLSEVEVVPLEIDLPENANPWVRFAGMFQDDPLFDEVVEEMEADRRELDAVKVRTARGRLQNDAAPAGILRGPGRSLYEKPMLTYKAMYKFLDEGVHAEVLDFPGVITCGDNLVAARRLLGSALVDMAETNLLDGEPLPQPDPDCTDPDADLEEPIHLVLRAASRERRTTVPRHREILDHTAQMICKQLGVPQPA